MIMIMLCSFTVCSGDIVFHFVCKLTRGKLIRLTLNLMMILLMRLSMTVMLVVRIGVSVRAEKRRKVLLTQHRRIWLRTGSMWRSCSWRTQVHILIIGWFTLLRGD